MSELHSLTKNRIISELSKSPHGSLKEYIPICREAATQEPEFLAHLIAWNASKGQVRDAKVALPLVSLSVPSFPDELADNSFAHLAKLNPRELLKAYRFALELKLPTKMRRVRNLVTLYLQQLEADGHWQHVALQHRRVLKLVKGQVWLVFFDTTPQSIDVTGLTLDQIRGVTQYIWAAGGTSIGCGLRWMLEMKKEIDGIAIVSDGCENSAPEFWSVYKQYSDTFGKEVPVYLYRFNGADDRSFYHRFVTGHELQEFDCRVGFDYYSLPNLVATMRTNRYSLVDEIMSTKLLKLSDVIKNYHVGTMDKFTRKGVTRNASA